MPAALADDSLIDRCLAGDRAAWEQLVERYTRLVWSITRKYGLREADAEDVHQAAFARLIKHLGELRNRERLSSWLITTTTRECWRVKRRSTRDTETLPADAAEPSELEVRDFEQRQLVREAMTQLNQRCRELLTALFAAVGEPHYPAIAERLGMPVGSIGPTRARCLERLESLLRGLGVGE